MALDSTRTQKTYGEEGRKGEKEEADLRSFNQAPTPLLPSSLWKLPERIRPMHPPALGIAEAELVAPRFHHHRVVLRHAVARPPPGNGIQLRCAVEHLP